MTVGKQTRGCALCASELILIKKVHATFPSSVINNYLFVLYNIYIIYYVNIHQECSHPVSIEQDKLKMVEKHARTKIDEFEPGSDLEAYTRYIKKKSYGGKKTKRNYRKRKTRSRKIKIKNINNNIFFTIIII